MSLKVQPDRPAVVPLSAPIWGVLADPGEPAGVVRFETADGVYSYPYHTLSRWVLCRTADELMVQAGCDTITVRGRQLASVRDALDTGRLLVLRATKERYIADKPGPVVTQVSISTPSTTTPDG